LTFSSFPLFIECGPVRLPRASSGRLVFSLLVRRPLHSTDHRPKLICFPLLLPTGGKREENQLSPFFLLRQDAYIWIVCRFNAATFINNKMRDSLISNRSLASHTSSAREQWLLRLIHLAIITPFVSARLDSIQKFIQQTLQPEAAEREYRSTPKCNILRSQK
jgi:hypothetical protein